MNPFTVPERVFVSSVPRDMRAGIAALARAVCAECGGDPLDGALYVFVSRDRRRCKMLRHEAGWWCMWTLMPAPGTFRWRHSGPGSAPVEVDRAALLALLSGLDPMAAIRARGR